MTECELIPVSRPDIPEIGKLARDIWIPHYTSILGKKQVAYMLETMYDKDSLQKQMAEGQQFFFIKYQGKDSGFVSLGLRNDYYFIHKFYISQDLQNKGLGSLVMEKVKIYFREWDGEKPIRLSVNRLNFKAISFYFKHGFKLEITANFDIGNGFLMNDFIMVHP